MKELKAPFPWFGGKSRVADLVWSRFGNVRNYVEPFFGSGAILLGRPHDPGTETVNDKDGYLVNFWRAGMVPLTDGTHLNIWSWLWVPACPLLGFLLPWGAVRSLAWVGAGFMRQER